MRSTAAASRVSCRGLARFFRADDRSFKGEDEVSLSDAFRAMHTMLRSSPKKMVKSCNR